MCAINPKQQMQFTLSVYTALNMSLEDFTSLVAEKVIDMELALNTDARLRWHVTEG